MLSTCRSLFWLRSLLLPLALLCLTATTVACGGSAPSGDAATEASATGDDATNEAPTPAQFRDGFESGDTSGWSGEGDGSEASGDDASTTDTPPPTGDG